MADFLTPVATTTVKRPEVVAQVSQKAKSTYSVIGSPETALEALKNQPDLDSVGRVLYYLSSNTQSQDQFSLAIPGPIAARVINTLVTITIPDYWHVFKETGKFGRKLSKCLRNSSGLGAIMARLQPLIADAREKKPVEQTRDPTQHIVDILEVLNEVLDGNDVFRDVYDGINTNAPSQVQRTMVWKEFVRMIASGRILSLAAQAEDILKNQGAHRPESWFSSGNEYATWVGRNIANMLQREDIEELAGIAHLCDKTLSLGYSDQLIGSLFWSLLQHNSLTRLHALLPKMAVHTQRQIFNHIITFIVKKRFKTIVDIKNDSPLQPLPTISGAACVFNELMKDNEALKEYAVSLLTTSTIPALDDSLTARRAVIAALSRDEERVQAVMEKTLSLFGDKLYITHTPILQQEALAQTLALSCGYVYRSQPMFLTLLAKSSTHINTMSNRIAATSPKARFLGMALGVAISDMVDKPDQKLKFDFEGDATEAKWYQHLTRIDDKIGTINDLKSKESVSSQKWKPSKGTFQSKTETKGPKKPVITEFTGPRITEVSSESEDDDLIPYGKPDSDPEDDTDDPTAIDRNKPTAPIYIRDLISGLRESENYDRHQLALQTSASLIRRKANFGTEVTDHIEELASILVGLNDNFELPNFNILRQQALIAILIAKPAHIAQWLSRSFFSGDYSITQRIAILTTLGLGARELAGFKEDNEDVLPTTAATPDFPTKKLPPSMHAIYTPDPDPVSRLTNRLASTTLSPLAASAADQLTGPNILKVRTFSSRMEVEKKRKKPIPNALAQIVADNFFFPLTGRWWVNLQSTSSSSFSSNNDSIYTSPLLLPNFLQTLAIILSASGPNTLSLPQMTREFWDLLLSVRGMALQDKGIMRALLFAFLMIIETNEDKERLVDAQGKELLETLEWTRGVFEGLGKGEEGGEDERLRALAAGVVVRASEVVEKYRRRMVGSMMDY